MNLSRLDLDFEPHEISRHIVRRVRLAWEETEVSDLFPFGEAEPSPNPADHPKQKRPLAA